VFVLLARKAHLFGSRTILQGWLHRTAWFTADNLLKTTIRRQNREQEACMQSFLNEPESESRTTVAPLLDSAIAGLGEKDRNAILLRFFDGRKLSEVAAALGTTEDGATKRVNRALEKLRRHFVRRGVVLTTATLVSLLGASSAQAAPAGLAAATVSASLAAVSKTGLSAWITSVTKLILFYKKTSIAIGIVLAATLTTPFLLVQDTSTASGGPPPFNYGLYIHFDISTFTGYRGNSQIGHHPASQYAPSALDVAGWILTAQQAGMDCAVLTVKHEAGFCLWDAGDYDYDVANSPVKTDVLAAFLAACQAGGIMPGIHYSIPDAHNEGSVRFKGEVSAGYFEFIKKQTRELHTRYPGIRVQVFDMAFRLSDDQRSELRELVRELNPACVVLCDLGNPAASKFISDTVNKDWFWSSDSSIASPEKLAGSHARAHAGGMPFLLNVGPDKSGRIPASCTAVLMKLKPLIGKQSSR
jgi:hypothetical protein